MNHGHEEGVIPEIRGRRMVLCACGEHLVANTPDDAPIRLISAKRRASSRLEDRSEEIRERLRKMMEEDGAGEIADRVLPNVTVLQEVISINRGGEYFDLSDEGDRVVRVTEALDFVRFKGELSTPLRQQMELVLYNRLTDQERAELASILDKTIRAGGHAEDNGAAPADRAELQRRGFQLYTPTNSRASEEEKQRAMAMLLNWFRFREHQQLYPMIKEGIAHLALDKLGGICILVPEIKVTISEVTDEGREYLRKVLALSLHEDRPIDRQVAEYFGLPLDANGVFDFTASTKFKVAPTE